MAQDAHTATGFETVFHVLGNLQRVSYLISLRYYYNAATFASPGAFSQRLAQAFNIKPRPGQDSLLGAAGYRNFQCDEASRSPHDLHKEDTLERVGSIADPVYGLQSRVYSGIEANSVIGAINIIIYCGRHPD